MKIKNTRQIFSRKLNLSNKISSKSMCSLVRNKWVRGYNRPTKTKYPNRLIIYRLISTDRESTMVERDLIYQKCPYRKCLRLRVDVRVNSFTILSMAMEFAATAPNVQSAAEHGRRRSDEKGRAEANFYSSKKLNRRVQDGPIKSQSRRAVRLPMESAW